jgi:hypothetical protein
VEERVDAFVAECLKLFNVTRGEDIMLTMGSDFAVGNSLSKPGNTWEGNLR